MKEIKTGVGLQCMQMAIKILSGLSSWQRFRDTEFMKVEY